MATTDYQLDYADRKAFEEDMRNMQEAPLTEQDLDRMYAEHEHDWAMELTVIGSRQVIGQTDERCSICKAWKAEWEAENPCDNCLVDTLESHTHRDGPWEDETEEIV